MPWPFYLALKQLFPTGRFPFFTLISVIGVMLGVAMLVIVTSVMGGFGHELRKMIVQTEGEVQIKARTPIEDVAGTMKIATQTPGVAAATPFCVGPVMVLASAHPAFPVFHGIDLATVEQVTNLSRFVRVGQLEDLDDDSIILSSQVAGELGASLGDRIEIYSPLLLEKLKSDEIFLPRQFRVVGFFEVGHQHIDSTTVYGTLRAMQELYGLGRTVHGINIRIKPGVSEDEVADRLSRVLPQGMRAFTWMQNWESFLWVLNLEKTLFFFILLVLVVIAAFSVMSSLLISVVRKTREIGLLGALGGSGRAVALCFCAQAFLIGVIGTAFGLALGFGVLAVRNNIVHGIAGALHREGTLREYYMFTDLPSNPQLTDMIAIVISAIVFSTIAGLLPAWRAARLKPVEALRSE